MIYKISTSKPNYHFVSYQDGMQPSYTQFLRGALEKTQGLTYSLERKSFVQQIQKCHLVTSVGPTLVSQRLRGVLESIIPGEIEFYSASINSEGGVINNYSAIRPKCTVECVDMEKSEYTRTNFDDRNPTYSFSYQKFLPEIPYGFNFVICEEFQRQMIVSEVVKEACFAAKLKGLQFCSSVDLTPANRGQCEIVR